MVVSSALSGGRSAKFREDVAYLGFGGIGRADRIDWAASLHSRPRSHSTAAKMAALQSPRPTHSFNQHLLTTNKHEWKLMTISSCPKAKCFDRLMNRIHLCFFVVERR